MNTVSKAVLGWMTGGRQVGERLLISSAAAIAAGFAGMLVAPALAGL